MMKKSDIERLESQGCYSDNWDMVTISRKTDLAKIRNVVFRGAVTIGENAEIINVPGGLKNVRIGNGVRISNVAKIENEWDAPCGVGISVSVLDETGSRPVRIYPGISAQAAALAARMPEFASGTLDALIDRHIEQLPSLPDIGDGVEILDCGALTNVKVWSGSRIEGAARLSDCSIVSNADDGHKSTFIGHGVNAENCIVEDATVAGGAFLRNTYVGQGSVIDKGFTSHDSLFFANCLMENGEACAVLAGPFSVSMHKSTLLIACQTSFMNAGSGTNMSNHMYKLGPVHWGILERGVKTSSNSYLMHGSRIGAFSLLLGDHKTHPDSSAFPFSYLIGDADGHTMLVPGAMLKSYGMLRDETKWQNRDRRKNLNLKRLNDRVDAHIFNPYSIAMASDALASISTLLETEPDVDGYIPYKGMNTSLRSLRKAKNLYELAISKYVASRMAGHDGGTASDDERWFDLAGQIMPESRLRAAMQARSVEELEKVFDASERDFENLERSWISTRFSDFLADRKSLEEKAAEYDALLETDRCNSSDMLKAEQEMLSFL